jgi:hypothetical protein
VNELDQEHDDDIPAFISLGKCLLATVTELGARSTQIFEWLVISNKNFEGRVNALVLPRRSNL